MTGDEKAAGSPADATVLRAYLQRAEVRLSTMHRIGGAFLGGAGLLLLLPAFLREALVEIPSVINKSIPEVAKNVQLDPYLVGSVLSIPVLIAYLIPVCALWLLLRDLTLFYYSANIPQDLTLGKATEPQFHPRFALTAIPFCDDEGTGIKTTLRATQFTSSLKFFLLPRRKRDRNWLSNLAKIEDEKTEAPRDQVALPDDDWLRGHEVDSDRRAMRMAFGLAGAYNRTLVQEVAKSELSLIRHNLNLRRLVLRYMKALLTLVWTTLVSFVVLAGLHNVDEKDKINAVVIGFLIWAFFAPLIVRAPLRWVYREADQNTDDATRDRQLRDFEQYVISGCLVAAVLASGAVYWLKMTLLGIDIWSYVLLLPLLPIIALLRSFGKLNFDIFRWV
ncbi:MAG: hypothetical protein WAS73_14630 [Defluviicoccus sp.]